MRSGGDVQQSFPLVPPPLYFWRNLTLPNARLLTSFIPSNRGRDYQQLDKWSNPPHDDSEVALGGFPAVAGLRPAMGREAGIGHLFACSSSCASHSRKATHEALVEVAPSPRCSLREDTMDTLTVAEHISRLLEEAGRPLSGTQLRELVRVRYPEFTPAQFGAVNLREFIRANVTGVREVGRAGGDFLYGTGTPDPSIALPPQSPDQVEQAVWRTYASPSSLYTLYVEPLTGEFRVARPGDPPLGEPWKAVAPCSGARHREIAEAFINDLPESVQQQLTPLLLGSEWWVAFFEKLRGLGLATQWNHYRREKIVEELTKTLVGLGASTARVQGLAQQRPLSGGMRPIVVAPTRTAAISRHSHDEVELRRIAAALVSRMSAHELRGLSVRLGDLLDIIGS